ncbi:MAG: HAMP domain-containing histidine kinase [Mollicutes bacterium]|nr:HAMP domain-containing histidine kinase [Mollicutes bacterium]
MKQNRNQSLSFTTLKYLVVFSITILFILWVFQILYLNFFYERYKIKNIESVYEYIIKNPNEYLEQIELKSYENGICSEIVEENKSIVYNPMYKGCILRHNNNPEINKIKRSLINKNEKIQRINLIDPEYDKKSILYSIKLNDNKKIYLNTTLEIIESTSQMLQGQLKYITMLVMTVSCFIAFFFSKTITKPIVKISNKAKEIGKGNLNIKFDKSNIRELDELSNTLNMTIKELKVTDDLRRDLMANISHDLKTPLTMIKAYAEMVKDISCESPEKRTEHLNIIISETERLNTLVNDILELSKIQSSTQELEITKVDLVKEVENIINSYSIVKEVLDYKFILDMPKKSVVMADKQKINRAIYNLINNAINYTGEDNTVYISIKEDKKTVTFSVKDTGKGIKKSEIASIWDRYYKNDKNHKRNLVGTGLGLAIVREVLESHNFKYGVNSKRNKGTEFYFIINKKDK